VVYILKPPRELYILWCFSLALKKIVPPPPKIPFSESARGATMGKKKLASPVQDLFSPTWHAFLWLHDYIYKWFTPNSIFAAGSYLNQWWKHGWFSPLLLSNIWTKIPHHLYIGPSLLIGLKTTRNEAHVYHKLSSVDSWHSNIHGIWLNDLLYFPYTELGNTSISWFDLL